ncbi:hypothetical protein DRQ18_00290 [bacterium]|nr:MAG: hypothetical protein DRQ18_00290 [bacterium]
MKKVWLLLIVMPSLSYLWGADVPIIFLHGNKAEAKPYDIDEDGNIIGGWTAWYPMDTIEGRIKYPTAMTKIIDSQYGGYIAENMSDNDKVMKSEKNVKKIYIICKTSLGICYTGYDFLPYTHSGWEVSIPLYSLYQVGVGMGYSYSSEWDVRIMGKYGNATLKDRVAHIVGCYISNWRISTYEIIGGMWNKKNPFGIGFSFSQIDGFGREKGNYTKINLRNKGISLFCEYTFLKFQKASFLIEIFGCCKVGSFYQEKIIIVPEDHALDYNHPTLEITLNGIYVGLNLKMGGVK